MNRILELLKLTLTVRIHGTARLVAWCILFYPVSCYQLPPCPSAEEGRAFVLECRSRGQSHWQLQGPGPQVKTFHVSETCDLPELGNVSVTMKQVDDEYVSLINISRVTASWRNQTLRCVVNNESNNTTECQMDNFYKPDSAQCEALKVGDKDIRVTCRTSRIYPKLRCVFKQFGSEFVEQAEITDRIEYTDTMLPTGHYNSTCSVHVRNLRPGQYQFFPVLMPAVDYKDYIRGMTVAVMPTSSIEIEALKPEVSILPHEPVHVCKGTQKTITFSCKTHKFEFLPSFEWLLWDPATNKTTGHSQGNATISTHETSYMSNFGTIVGHHHVGNHIVCSASYLNITAKLSVPVNVLLTPPPNPIFTDLNGRRIDGIFSLNRNHRQTLVCTVDKEELFLIHVHCHNYNKSLVASSRFHNKLTFAVAGWSFDSARCICTIEDSCYKVTAAVHIQVIPNQNITNTNKEIIHDDTGINYSLYVFVGIIALIFLVALIFWVVCFLCHRKSYRQHTLNYGDHLYETVK